jgi:hypothetical protein
VAPRLDAHAHQLVVRRVELDLVDAMSEPIVRSEHGGVPIGERRHLDGSRIAHEP